MTNLSIASVARIESVEEARKTLALFCCIGLMASVCLMTMGIDIGAAWL